MRLKVYLKEKSNKSKRKNVKISYKKEINHDLFPSYFEFDDNDLCDDIQIQYMKKYLEYEDALVERYFEYWNMDIYMCDFCYELCPGNIKFDFSGDIKCCKTCYQSMFSEPWNKGINH
jgi:hypothetical protein